MFEGTRLLCSWHVIRSRLLYLNSTGPIVEELANYVVPSSLWPVAGAVAIDPIYVPTMAILHSPTRAL